jgi:hypothetical protein
MEISVACGTSVHILSQLDMRHIPANKGEIRLFCKVRNEVPRLPYLLAYYRKMGFNRFFFVDNDSNDGTVDYLLAQEDCHLFQTKDSYREALSGTAWDNALLNLYGVDHWCAVIDTDELLVYPHSETVGIHEFCRFLESEGSEGLFTFMLDMYHSDLSKAVCEPGKPFTEICPQFDKDYVFVKRFSFKPGKVVFPATEVLGGPRLRKFYPEQLKTDKASRFRWRIVTNIAKIAAATKLISSKQLPHNSPELCKIPLLKWRKGNAYTFSTHSMQKPIKLSFVTGVLLHFKFFSDLYEKAEREASRGQYSGGGIEYQRYLKCLRRDPSITFSYKGSVIYLDSSDLLSRGLIRSQPAYERFIKE